MWCLLSMLGACASDTQRAAVSSEPPPTAQFTLYEDRQPIGPDSLSASVSNGWVVVKSSSPTSVELFERRVELGQDSVVVLGTTSELLFCLVLAGEATDELGVKAFAGKVLAWTHFGTFKGASLHYDAKGFASRLDPATHGDLLEVIQSTADTQAMKRYWGLLRPTKTNLANPYNQAYESGRKRFLNLPVVVSLKQKSSAPTEYAESTARRFIEAIGAKDSQVAAALLNPLLFVAEGSTPFSNDQWVGLRERFASSLVAQEWPIESGSLKRRSTGGPVQFEFSVSQQAYVLELGLFEDTYFVHSIEKVHQ